MIRYIRYNILVGAQSISVLLHYIMIKGSIQEEDITIVNIYAPSIGLPQYTRQTLTGIRGEINKNTIIVGDVNTPFNTNGQIIKTENQ